MCALKRHECAISGALHVVGTKHSDVKRIASGRWSCTGELTQARVEARGKVRYKYRVVFENQSKILL
jgi:hypothetical protein